jgi:hypothetical protein
MDVDGLTDVVDLGVVSGSIDDFGEGGMLLGVRQAEALGLVAGDDITVTFPETGDVTLTVAGTFERDAIVGSAYVVSLDDFGSNVTSRLDEAILVTTAGDVGCPRREAVTAAPADYPNVKAAIPPGARDGRRRWTRCWGSSTALPCPRSVAIPGITTPGFRGRAHPRVT